jgi:hypothetical protein
MLTRYEELTRKAYSILAAANRAGANGSHRFQWMWHKKFCQLIDQRDAMPSEEARGPAINPKMGKYALS